MAQDTKKINKYNYDNKYKKEHYKRVTILVPQNDLELLDYIDSMKSKSSYILGLIKKDMLEKKQ